MIDFCFFNQLQFSRIEWLLWRTKKNRENAVLGTILYTEENPTDAIIDEEFPLPRKRTCGFR